MALCYGSGKATLLIEPLVKVQYPFWRAYPFRVRLPFAAWLGIARPFALENDFVLVGVVGVKSRSGAAFIEYIRRHEPDIAYRGFARECDTHVEDPNVVCVARYDAIPAEALSGCDAIINFVGSVTASSSEELWAVNVAVPRSLTAIASEARIPHLIQMSSLSLHGPLHLIGSGAPLKPTTDYGRSKLAAERAIIEHRQSDLVVTLLRVPTIYGRRTPSKLEKLVAIMRRLPIFPAPAPLPRRSVISHENLARFLVHLLRERPDGVVYGADPDPFTLDMLAQVLPNRPRIVHLPAALFRPLRTIAPGAYASLYEPGEIGEALLLRPPGLITTLAALRSAFGSAR